MNERKEPLVTRTIITTICNYDGYDFSSGTPVRVEENPISIYSTRKLGVKDVERVAEIKKNPALIYVVSNVDYKEEVRGITLKEFVEKSVVVERPESQKKSVNIK